MGGCQSAAWLAHGVPLGDAGDVVLAQRPQVGGYLAALDAAVVAGQRRRGTAWILSKAASRCARDGKMPTTHATKKLTSIGARDLQIDPEGVLGYLGDSGHRCSLYGLSTGCGQNTARAAAVATAAVWSPSISRSGWSLRPDKARR